MNHRRHSKLIKSKTVSRPAPLYVPWSSVARSLETRRSAEDLKRIARRLGLPVSGTKRELAMQIAEVRQVRMYAR